MARTTASESDGATANTSGRGPFRRARGGIHLTLLLRAGLQEPSVVDQRPLFPRKAIDPDAALVEQLRGGEAGAADALVGAYGDRVYRLTMRITGNASDAEEVVQDTLWTARRKIETFLTLRLLAEVMLGRRDSRTALDLADEALAEAQRGGGLLFEMDALLTRARAIPRVQLRSRSSAHPRRSVRTDRRAPRTLQKPGRPRRIR